MKIIFLISLLNLSASLQSFASTGIGDRVGNGGDGCIAEFLVIRDRIRDNSSLISKLRQELLRQFDETRFHLFISKLSDSSVVIYSSTRDFLIDPVTDKQVEATNDGQNEIQVGQFWCKKNPGPQKDALVLHEYLGLAGLERSLDYSFTRHIFPDSVVYYDRGSPIIQVQLRGISYHVEDLTRMTSDHLGSEIFIYFDFPPSGAVARQIDIHDEAFLFSNRKLALTFTDWLKALSRRDSDGIPLQSGDLILPILVELDQRKKEIKAVLIKGTLN